jgi:hypothetical protein
LYISVNMAFLVSGAVWKALCLEWQAPADICFSAGPKGDRSRVYYENRIP